MTELTMPDGVRYLPGYLERTAQGELLDAVRRVIDDAPLYVPTMPKTGRPLSVRMTNCGPLGWLTSKEDGYRYQKTHPETGRLWPEMPPEICQIWKDLAEFDAPPEACLINWYEASAKLGLHVDRDEQEFNAPVISVSLGDDAWFRIGGLKRRDPTSRVLLKSGDVIVLSGPARLIHHGIDRILPGTSDLIATPGRFNLTMRRVTPV